MEALFVVQQFSLYYASMVMSVCENADSWP